MGFLDFIDKVFGKKRYGDDHQGGEIVHPQGFRDAENTKVRVQRYAKLLLQGSIEAQKVFLANLERKETFLTETKANPTALSQVLDEYTEASQRDQVVIKRIVKWLDAKEHKKAFQLLKKNIDLADGLGWIKKSDIREVLDLDQRDTELIKRVAELMQVELTTLQGCKNYLENEEQARRIHMKLETTHLEMRETFEKLRHFNVEENAVAQRIDLQSRKIMAYNGVAAGAMTTLLGTTIYLSSQNDENIHLPGALLTFGLVSTLISICTYSLMHAKEKKEKRMEDFLKDLTF